MTDTPTTRAASFDTAGTPRDGAATPTHPAWEAVAASLRRLAAVVLTGLVGFSVFYLFMRFPAGNFGTVVPGLVYRSAQPGEGQLRKWKQRYHIRTVVNLRGPSSHDIYESSVEAARHVGLRHVDVRLNAHEHPPAPDVRALVDVLDDVSLRPLLLHCRDGADRTGVASVLAAMAVRHEPFRQARRHLSLRHLHVDGNPEHIGGLLDMYASWCRQTRRSPDRWANFRYWARHVYHPYYYHVEIDAPAGLTLRQGQDVTLRVRLTNRSAHVLPAGRPGKRFRLVPFTGSGRSEQPDREWGPRTLLPARDIAPGETIELKQYIRRVHVAPGTYELRFDIIEEGVTWFARQGSPVSICRIHVRPREASASRPETSTRPAEPASRRPL